MTPCEPAVFIPLGRYFTVRELRTALATCDADQAVCVNSGFVTEVISEPGANEPYVLLLGMPEGAK